jgi:hypothetical protein
MLFILHLKEYWTSQNTWLLKMRLFFKRSGTAIYRAAPKKKKHSASRDNIGGPQYIKAGFLPLLPFVIV